jgi:hypothetical protein
MPSFGERCGACGSDQYVEVYVFSSAGPISRVCTSCGASDRPEQPVHFRMWRGRPEYMAAPGWTPGDADFLDGPAFVIDDEPPYVTIWCGPPAPHPLPPTPEEIIAGAAWLTAPSATRADLSGHRVYHWELA